MFTLRAKVVVITGAASGIGRALALECARRGAHLMLADLDEAGLAAVAKEAGASGTRCHTLRVDTGREQDIHELARVCKESLGGADVLINNAGVALMASLDKLQMADAHWLMNINFWGVVHGCRAFLPQLRLRPQAVLVNISSIFAMVSVPSQNMYNAAKAAVRGFSDALREEMRPQGVQVLCVHPGGIKTRIVEQARFGDISETGQSAQEMKTNFQIAAQTTPESAAAQIIRAVETGQARLLIGKDAKFLDLMFRIFPASASRRFTALVNRRRDRLMSKYS